MREGRSQNLLSTLPQLPIVWNTLPFIPSPQGRGSEKIPQESQKNLVLRVTPARRSMSYGEAISNSLIYTNARLILRLRRIAKTAMRLFQQAVWT